MRQDYFVATSLACDPHTEGMHNASKIASFGGIKSVIMSPSFDYNPFYKTIDELRPKYIGLSYRQDEHVAKDEVFKVVNYLFNTGLVT